MIIFVGFVVVAWLCAGLLVGQALRYRARLRAAEAEDAAPTYTPKATVIAPCKGLDAAFEANILALLRQDYPDYEVIFVTASRDEPAYARLAPLVQRYPGRACLTAAGPARGRSQKVHNQLHALRLAAATSEAFVFVDSDGRSNARLLRHLVAPLADAGVGAATGYRWFTPARRGLLPLLSVLWGALVAPAQADPRFAQLWGGAMAIRREYFEALAVAQAWAGASTDDDALTRVVRRAGLSIVLAPQCYVLSTGAGSWREFMAWGMRQLLLMRIYLPGMWWLGLGMTAITALTPVVGLAITGVALIAAPGLLVWGLLLLGAGLGLPLSSAIAVRSTERLLNRAPRAIHSQAFEVCDTSQVSPMPETSGQAIPRLAWPYFLACLPGAWVFWAHFIRSSLTRRVVWQGVTYELLGPERTVVVDG